MYIRPLFYNIITVTLRFSHGFSTKCIGKKTMSIGVHQIIFFFDLGFMVYQDYFTHFAPSQSVGGGEVGYL